MCLDPSEAIRDYFDEFGKFIGDDTKIHVYQIDLTGLDGVWPRVNYQQYNGYELQWQSRYQGKIPATALKWVNSMTLERYQALSSVAP